MRRLAFMIALLGTGTGVPIRAWRRNPRIGAAYPALVTRGLVGSGSSERATLEHIGRRSGIRRLTPVHPEATKDGVRILVPLGSRSEWARNVLAAGRCRLQLHGDVIELEEPALVPGSEVGDTPGIIRRAMAALGFAYLELRAVARSAGELDAEPQRQTAPGVRLGPAPLETKRDIVAVGGAS